MNRMNESSMRAVLLIVDLLDEVLEEVDPASAGNYFYTSPKWSSFSEGSYYLQ